MKSADISAVRQRHLGRGVSLSYRKPLTIVRGEGQYLFDENGKRYLDCVNNVCHVGHCHPYVVAAGAAQMAQLNTNTRYLYPALAQYAEALTARFPAPLKVCYLVNSGSEAVELALRMARNYTDSDHVIAVESAYHGNTTAAIAVSEYKFAGPGGKGCPTTTHVAPLPCVYRGRYRGGGPAAGQKYAAHVAELAGGLSSQGKTPAGFIAESMISVGGQIILPDGYLAASYKAVRQAGGICIADEVQVGFGRPGRTFWGFELQGVVPDIVTLGKPIGNGHPMGAVVTTSAIDEAFANGMEYFNTFGGNPVSCAVGLAVLDVIDKEQLQRHALATGKVLLEGLNSLKEHHHLVGDVRGQGLFAGIELVSDRKTLRPASNEACEIVNRMKDAGFLLSVDGPLRNVIKIKPPMVISGDDVDRLIGNLDQVLCRMG